MDNKEAYEAKSLSQMFETQERLTIQQQNENIFLVNQNQEKQKITQFKDELIKVLKQFIMSLDDIRLNMIENIFQNQYQGFSNSSFIELKFQKQHEYVEEYINLMLFLQNKQEDFVIEITNPFNNKKLNWFEMYAEKMTICVDKQKNCGECDNHTPASKQLSTSQCIEQIKKYQLPKIKIDSIQIYTDSIPCSHFECWERRTQFFADMDISDIKCNKVEINHQVRYGSILTINTKLSIQNPLKLLKIEVEENECGNFQNQQYVFKLNINFLNKSSYISELEIHLPEIKDDESKSELDLESQQKLNLKELFKYDKILEYKICIQTGDYKIFQSLKGIDINCEKIIFFSIDDIDCEYLEKFIEVRNEINTIRYQLIPFHNLISPFLNFSPIFTFMDLHEDFLLN